MAGVPYSPMPQHGSAPGQKGIENPILKNKYR